MKLEYLGSVAVVCEVFHVLNQAESCFSPGLKPHMKHGSGDQSKNSPFVFFNLVCFLFVCFTVAVLPVL